MRVIVTGRNGHVSKKLKDQATEKLRKVERFFDRIQTMEIEFIEERNPRIADNKHRVEVTVTTKHHVMRAHASGPDPVTAIDAAENKMEAQVKRLKSRFVRRGSRVGRRFGRRRATSLRDLPALEDLTVSDARNGPERPISSEDRLEEGEAGPRVTKVTRFAVKPMTVEEAILQMGSLGHDFYLFVNAESEQAGVVYRRNDGSFGLIEPE